MAVIYAHRGASGYAPENTLRAFALAADMKADAVELDVQRTADGQLVVFHDETLGRVTEGTGRLCDHTLSGLSRYPVTLHRAGIAEPIPLLRDVLLLLKERGLGVNIELKNTLLPYEGLEEETLALVEDTGMKGKAIYSSFNHFSLARIKELDPEAYCGMLYECMMLEPWAYAAGAGMNALHPHHPSISRMPEIVTKARELGVEVNPWTVNDDADIRAILGCGCAGIITNYPDRAREIMKTEFAEK